MKKSGIIYIAINKINNKQYIGQTIQTLEHRKNKHYKTAINGSPLKFHRALLKYDIENFEWKILEENVIDLDNKEQYYINLLHTKNPNGYNLTNGGRTNLGMKHSKKSKEKISKAIKGHKMIDRYTERYGQEKGEELYKEYCDKMIKQRKGKKRIDLLIEKYGVEEGTKKYNGLLIKWSNIRKNKPGANTLSVLIEKYGVEEGTKRYNLFCNKMKNLKHTEETKKIISEKKKEYWKQKKSLNLLKNLDI
jgi:group I intron endonuclease